MSGRPVNLAKETTPGLQTRAGPLGPSGVTPACSPALTTRVRVISAAAPRLLEEPRTALSPIRRKKATSQPPSLLVLMSALIGRRKCRRATRPETKSRSCQRTMIRPPSASSMAARLERIRRVANQSRSNKANGATQSQWYQGTTAGVSGSAVARSDTPPLTHHPDRNSNTYRKPSACRIAGRASRWISGREKSPGCDATQAATSPGWRQSTASTSNGARMQGSAGRRST